MTTLSHPTRTPASPLQMTARYSWLSAVGVFRSPRFLIFTAMLPMVMYLLFNGLYGNEAAGDGSAMTAGAYLMVSMACYGAIGGSLNAGARVALERQSGWNRQLRLTALPPAGYMVAKAIVSMVVALPSILLVFLLGAFVGHNHLSAMTWITTGLAIWLCVIPFAVIGLVIGSLVGADSTQPVVLLLYLGLSILGGLWVPVDQFSSLLQNIAKATPTYWMADIGRSVLAGDGFSWQGVGVLAAWTVVLGAVGVAAYRRSGKRG